MLSILIPVYNYNVFALVKELHDQCTESEIEFEIICLDDASKVFNTENQKITQFTNASFHTLETNIGRSAIRNLLAKKARFQNLIFLDADTIPVHDNFISNYIFQINNEKKIVYGGILYQIEKPSKEKLLRWVYGRQREALSVSVRNQNPGYSALTSNLLIKKDIIIQYPFDNLITGYGYEDLCFFTLLNTNHFEVYHIENPIYHLDLETSDMFLKKTKIALENLILLEKSKKISAKESKIIAAQQKLEKIKLTTSFIFIFEKIKIKIKSNLLSEKPSLFWFDIYKLGYYCNLKSAKK